jgi:DNA polymerase
MPDEIESCKPWLKEQIDLIDPRVIVTLGNFSTQLLLGRKVGISRVRGQRFEWRGRVLIPTFHPAAILRSGSAGLAMQQIEQDFLLVRKTLDEAPEGPEQAREQLGLF